ncbi:MAG: hypothetical protein L3K18_03285 [Thermoplasmata archaeon]|nr:hypothetical protein [Thermoplasmata archaeon]MCI4356155.1 hypothetical protein [Thermoplasmata archaeon]
MRGRHLGSDLALVADGLRIGKQYGFHSLEVMAVIAWYLERSIYERGSLRSIPGGIAFDLRNPPLRMGAFRAASLAWDGDLVPPSACTVHPSDRVEPIPFDSVSADSPLELRPGIRIEFTAAVGAPSPGPHSVRLELRSLAIPPIVWFEVMDHVKVPEAPGS